MHHLGVNANSSIRKGDKLSFLGFFLRSVVLMGDVSDTNYTATTTILISIVWARSIDSKELARRPRNIRSLLRGGFTRNPAFTVERFAAVYRRPQCFSSVKFAL